MKVTAVFAVVAALAVAELVMQPSSRDRWQLAAVFVGAGAVTLASAWLAARLVPRFGSLRTGVAAVSMAGVITVAAVVTASAGLMFISAHDLRLSLIAVGLGVALGLVVAGSLAKSLTGDLDNLREAARQIGAGHRGVRSGVDRGDEVGELAATLDEMSRQLGAAEADRRRMESARREFLAAVGHDLRTPLTSLRAAVEALQDGIAPEPERYLAAMAADLDLMQNLVEDLFLLARIETGDLDLLADAVDLTELADETVEAMSPLAYSRDVELELDADARVGVSGGPKELRRVFRNLLDNAIRHAPRRSQVTVRVTNGRSQATVLVADDGPGFPAGFDEVAFDGFSKADASRRRSSGGAGLGLAIAKGVVEAHGGSIWIEPGPGGKVAFSLPVG